jgi:prepilin-type processing-associated H-X9-DG protein
MKLKQSTSQSGLTLIELMVAVGVLVLLGLILIPGRPERAIATRINCVINLKQVGLAYRQWSIDHNDKFPMEVSSTNGGAMEAAAAGNVAAVFQVMSNELNTPKLLFCPAEKRRVPSSAFTPAIGNSNVTYFVGLDVTTNSSPQMFLSGDDNLLIGGEGDRGLAIKGTAVKSGVLSLWTNTPAAWSDERHMRQGNVGLADGSVQQFSNRKLVDGLRHTGEVTNRLMLP